MGTNLMKMNVSEISEIHNYIVVVEVITSLCRYVGTDLSSLHSTEGCVLVSSKDIYILPKSSYTSTGEYGG